MNEPEWMLQLNFKVETSEVPQTCWRCTSIGLPENTIEPGESHLVIRRGNKITARACTDCYTRLHDEVETSEEGEDWKDKDEGTDQCRFESCHGETLRSPTAEAPDLKSAKCGFESRRKENNTCKQGHELLPGNCLIAKSGPRKGRRTCRTCRNASHSKWLRKDICHTQFKDRCAKWRRRFKKISEWRFPPRPIHAPEEQVSEFGLWRLVFLNQFTNEQLLTFTDRLRERGVHKVVRFRESLSLDAPRTLRGTGLLLTELIGDRGALSPLEILMYKEEFEEEQKYRNWQQGREMCPTDARKLELKESLLGFRISAARQRTIVTK